MSGRRKLQPNARLRFDGEWYRVLSLDGPSMMLRADDGRPLTVITTEVIGAPDFAVLGEEPEEEGARPASYFDDLAPEVRAQAEERRAHVCEAYTGYRSGTSADALPEEPRPEFDPVLVPLETRLESKSNELKALGWDDYSTRSLKRWAAAYKDRGILGLVDGRRVRPLKRHANLDERVVQAIEAVLSDRTERSTVSKNEIRRLVQLWLDEEFGEGVVACPPRSTFNRHLNELARGRATFGPAKRRRSRANLPDRPFSRFSATRPGEVVLIDSSRFDVFAVDPVTFQWVALVLTVALDLYTRRIVAWRFTPRAPKSVDAALLLHDMLNPRRSLLSTDGPASNGQGWAHRYPGVPHLLLIGGGGEKRTGALMPASGCPVWPETVVVDHAKIHLSQNFMDACKALKCSIQLARVLTATDKAQIERMFRTIGQSLLEKLPGYKGPDVSARGADPEGEALFFTDEIEAIFSEWLELVYHRRHHDGLELPGRPHLNMSPNDMYDEGIARRGVIEGPSTQTLYYDLLPTNWGTIQDYGVGFRSLVYDDVVLNGFRHERSPFNGLHKGKWPIKYDPRDLSRIFFKHPDKGTWHELGRVGAEDTDRPFTDLTRDYAKRLVRERGGNSRNHEELNRALDELLRRYERNELQGRREQRLAAVERARRSDVGRDRPAATTLLDDQDTENDDGLRTADLFEFDDLEPFPIAGVELSREEAPASNGRS